MRRTGAGRPGELPEMAAGEKLNGIKPRKGVVGDSNERRSRTGKSHRGKGRGALLVSALRKLPEWAGRATMKGREPFTYPDAPHRKVLPT